MYKKLVFMGFLLLITMNISYSQTPIYLGKAVSVDLSQAWTDTKLDLAEGDSILIISKGIWNAWYFGNHEGAKSASRFFFPPNGAQLGSSIRGVLMAKIGDGQTFNVNELNTFQADASGRLYLGVLDDYHLDNFGFLMSFIFKVSKIDSIASTEKISKKINVYNNSLKQNYPNPFNPQTKIEYAVQKNDEVEIYIFNELGQVVKQLVNEYKSVGNYFTTWDGTDDKGFPVSNGIYFYQLKVGEYISSKKMLLIK